MGLDMKFTIQGLIPPLHSDSTDWLAGLVWWR